MIEMNLTFFSTTSVEESNFSVHPSRTNQLPCRGRTGVVSPRFATELVKKLNNPRLLGTDRLRGMEQVQLFRQIQGDLFEKGFNMDHFKFLRQAGKEGSGIDFDCPST